MEAALEEANIVVAAGPAGVQLLGKEVWSANPTIELLVDYNAADPLGIEGIEAGDDPRRAGGEAGYRRAGRRRLEDEDAQGLRAPALRA